MDGQAETKRSADPAEEVDNAIAAAEREAQRAEAEAERLAAGVRDDVAEKAAQSARSAAGSAGATFADQAAATADAARDRAAQSDASLQTHAFEAASVFLENTAADLRNADFDAVIDDTRKLARRHPLAFVVGAAAIGLAAARLARATDPDADDGAGG